MKNQSTTHQEIGDVNRNIQTRTQDVTKNITESSLPPKFKRHNAPNCMEDITNRPSSTVNFDMSEENSDVITSKLLGKEAKADNVWCAIGNLIDIFTHRNYESVIKKQMLQEITTFKEKAEGWLAEYWNFVDDVNNCK